MIAAIALTGITAWAFVVAFLTLGPRSRPRQGLSVHQPDTLMALADATRERRTDPVDAEADAMFAQWERQFRSRT